MTRSYTASPLCGPSRFALMTGIPTGRSRVRGNAAGTDLAAGDASLPRLLKQKGYRTYLVGKWGLGAQLEGWDRFLGFQSQAEAHYVFPSFLWRSEAGVRSKLDLSAANAKASPARCHCEMNATCALDAGTGLRQNSPRCRNANAEFRRQALAFVDEHAQSGTAAPFFLMWGSIAPHAGLYSPAQPLSRPHTSPVSTYGRYAGKAKALGAARAGHMATITHELDADVGALLDKLRARGLDGSTLLIFMSDNGPHVETNPETAAFFSATMGLRGVKRDVLEGGVRSPTIVRWPGRVAAGSVSSEFHAGYDLPLTVAALIGVPATDPALAPFAAAGAASFHRALLGLPSDAKVPRRKGIELEICIRPSTGCDFAFYDLSDPKRVVKVVRRGYRNELYDLSSDPFESDNLFVSQARAAPAMLNRSLSLMAALALRVPDCPYSQLECATSPK
jgi:arylsulfatase A-like enzyme